MCWPPLLTSGGRRATFRVFKIERKLYGREDVQFLERVFQKLLLNFTWRVGADNFQYFGRRLSCS